MPKAIMFVQSRPSAPDREDEYNDWYTNTHLPEVLDVPGITAARRFKASDAAPPAEGAHQYCAVYELDVDDLSTVMPALAERFADGSMHMSDAMEMDPTPSFVIYELVE
jgi:hypothetical protein